MSNVVPIKAPIRLRCSSCGIAQDAACDCGAPYVPAGLRAQQAVVQFPERSNRAIAADLGVDRKTVDRVREATGGANDPPDTRTPQYEALTGPMDIWHAKRESDNKQLPLFDGQELSPP